jgi:hypothetical protein
VLFCFGAAFPLTNVLIDDIVGEFVAPVVYDLALVNNITLETYTIIPKYRSIGLIT